jgi:RNA polymerase sigma factor (sigma-70 family)
MRGDGWRSALEHLCLANGGGLSDGQLLARFLDGHEEAAFAALVRRHGPMVLGVCRRLLGNAHDAEDAFQATFLVLARKAASVVKREAVASFLYGVAYRTALRAKVRADKRRAMERQVEDMPHPEVAPAAAQDWRPLLDRELSRLPEKYRAAIVLCDLECKTRQEAARQLSVPEGTLASRLATGRRMLASRLVRCGLALSGGALAVALAEGGASAAVPAQLVVQTVEAAALVAAGQTAGVATPAVVLMNEVLRAMLMTKLKVCVAAAVVAVLLSAGGLAFRAAGQPPAPAGAAPSRAEARPLSELELLRREVDILKLQVEVLQDKMRAQEAELSALHGKAGAGPTTAAEAPRVRRNDASTGKMPPADEARSQDTVGPEKRPGSGFNPAPRREQPLGYPGTTPPGNRRGTGANLDPEPEAALKALREAPDDTEVRRRAVEVLERALQRLKERPAPEKNTPNPGR